MNLSKIITTVFLSAFSLSAPSFAEEWIARSIDQVGKGADGVRFADVNGDGLLDIASGWEEAGETRVYLHPGVDRLSAPWPKVVVGQSGPVEDAVFGDFDGDGAVDVISASEDKNLYMHWAPKPNESFLDAGKWTTEVIPVARGLQRWMITLPIQLDGKHGPDIIAAGKGPQIVWLESPENARDLDKWKLHVISDKGGWTMGQKAVDMDGDGDMDVLVSIRTTNPGVKWLENPGTGADQKEPWKMHEISDASLSGFVAVADLDGDGFLDVVSPLMDKEKKILRIYRGLGKDATRWEAMDIELPKNRNKGVAIGDVDLDGQMEILVSHEYAEIYVLKHDGKLGPGHWSIKRIASGGKFDDLTLYDVDQDGDKDVFTTDEQGLQVVWYENPTK